MLVNLVGYWALGLPLGAWLCFRMKLGAMGMWIGLCLALVIIGSILVGVWSALIRQLMAEKLGSGAEASQFSRSV
jgi:MATE family multidrug resistance protein